MSNSDHMHGGHRLRLFEKILRFGPDIFSDHELLEILLFFSIPRTNTNDIAHRLINRFGSLSGVFSADFEQLLLVEGVGTRSAQLIVTVGALISRSKKKPVQTRKQYSTVAEIGEMLSDYYQDVSNERFCALYFDASMRLIEMSVLAEGSIGKVSVTPSKITRDAILKGAAGVIIAHNHPLGAASLSSSDRNVTHIVEASLAVVDIPLIEHIIVGEVGYAPTMLYKASFSRPSLFANAYGDAFCKKFYNI